MQTAPITPAHLSNSVIAVPPLARNADGIYDVEENTKLIRHIESGGVSTLLYGGNANFYHIALSEYASVLEGLIEASAEETLIVPAAGPAFGFSMDQAAVLSDFDFPTVMVLPHQGISTPDGVEAGLRKFAEAFGKPIVVYIKFDGFLEPANVKRLVDDGLVSWIKYATVREDPRDDDYLRELVDVVDPQLIVSGIGEQPAIVHVRDFGLNSFTSGCVCVRPDLSQAMLEALKSGDDAKAESIRQQFEGLEDQRNAINPIRVLHEAVALGGIANTGPHLPLLSALSESEKTSVSVATQALLNS